MANRRRSTRSASPVERPTEWTAAVSMLAVAGFMFSQDRDVAALTATAAACLPAIVTAIVEYVRNRATKRVTDVLDEVDDSGWGDGPVLP